MLGFESICALTREAMMFRLGVVDDASTTVLGFEGRRPRRPLRLSVRTTEKARKEQRKILSTTL